MMIIIIIRVHVCVVMLHPEVSDEVAIHYIYIYMRAREARMHLQPNVRARE
jgi:hypothetical protein